MSVGLALIAKNEAERLPALLESIEGAFDQVVLVDTGSTDKTARVFIDWASRQDGLAWDVGYFKWTKDFAAARAHAQAQLTTEWEVWADCDDVIVGAQNIRQLCANAPEELAAYVAGYNYAQHPETDACINYLRRERIVRKGKGRWVNRVHEAQVVEGPVQIIDKSVVEWVHRKQAYTVEEVKESEARRNLDILDAWVLDEPKNTRVLAYLGTEHAARGEIDEALAWFDKYLEANPDWDEERAQVYRKIAVCHLMQNRPDAAIDCAFSAVRLMPTWTDSYITLGEAYLTKGEYHKAIEWAREALRRGEPPTMLIINPLDYTFQPRKLLAGALASVGQLDEAIKVGMEAWQLNPSDQGLGGALNEWRSAAKVEHTANSVAMLAQQLIAHDEQLKALYFLENCVPHFANEHQGVVQLRSMLRERLEWAHNPRSLLEHYEEGGSKPEDFLPDDKLEEVPAALPRVQFLYNGIHEQMLEQHQEGIIQPQVEAAMAAANVDPA